jgi:hypothetical protein
MGFFDSIFGGGKRKTTEIPDGLWLSGERDSSWREIAKSNSSETMDYSPESCFTNSTGTFVVIRITKNSTGKKDFLGCIIPTNPMNTIYIAVRRSESLSGNILDKDHWSNQTILTMPTRKGIDTIINTARNTAAFNNYSNLPPYVLWLSMKFNE